VSAREETPAYRRPRGRLFPETATSGAVAERPFEHLSPDPSPSAERKSIDGFAAPESTHGLGTAAAHDPARNRTVNSGVSA
jgi:hypothetical protein